jgi:hypothetical protein
MSFNQPFRRYNVLLVCLVLVVASFSTLFNVSPPALAQQARPFSLPFSTPPGPQTWLLGQPYGNTPGAFNFGRYWYAAGQGLHFGIDFNAPCGTPVVAVADGIVDYVDNFIFGLRPHNVVISHPATGTTSLYGHLLQKSPLVKGMSIKRGDVIGFSGDPDETCVSRPHLHFEVRRDQNTVALNPVPMIDADWNMLASIGHYGATSFAKDLYNPRQWQLLDTQPEVTFGGPTLNKFADSWPPPSRVAASAQTQSAVTAPQIAEYGKLKFLPLVGPDCCANAWFTSDSQEIRYLDGESGQLAYVMGMKLSDPQPEVIDKAPPPLWSNNGEYRLRWDGGRANIERLTDLTSWSINTGAWPTFSPNSMQIMWQYLPADVVPGTAAPTSEIWIAKPDGSDLQMVARQSGGAAYWLDDDRLLLLTRKNFTNRWTLNLYSLTSKVVTQLVEVENLRGLSIAPGGGYVMYFSPFRKVADDSGVYLLRTSPGTTPVKLPFFGSWRWRDSNSVIYIPFEPNKPMQFVLYNVASGSFSQLSQDDDPAFSIVNDDWSVSPDGRKILMWQSATEGDFPVLTLVTLPG